MLNYLKENDVQCGIHYPVPIYSLGAYTSLGLTGGSYPITEKYSKEILSLPMYPELTEVQIDEVVSAIKKFYEGESCLN